MRSLRQLRLGKESSIPSLQAASRQSPIPILLALSQKASRQSQIPILLALPQKASRQFSMPSLLTLPQEAIRGAAICRRRSSLQLKTLCKQVRTLALPSTLLLQMALRVSL